MKKIGYIILGLLIGINSNGQNMNDEKSSTFEVKHYDFFTFMESEPNPKEWGFELTITEIEDNKFEACYSKELVNCLFHLHELRKENISIDKEGVCFRYFLDEDNNIQITDKKDVLEYLIELKAFKSANYKRKRLKEILDNADFYLEYDDELDRSLARELVLIHEYENMNISIGVSGTIDQKEEEINFEELEDDEIDFLNKINWESINRIDVYRTPEINESEFLFDYMFGVDVLTSDERANFEEISQTYFKGNLELDDYENITLNRDQRHLNKETKKLSYLLKHRRTVSPKMKKITKLEIIKKGNNK